MKKLIILLAITISGEVIAQTDPTSVYLGQDENNHPIYQNVSPFYTLGSKIAMSVCGGGITAVITKIICDRRREDAQRPETFEQENITI